MKIKLNKNLFKKIALALTGVAVLAGAVFGVKAIVDYTKNDLKKITPTFEVGNLGSDGKFVDDESTLYTKEAFGCYGLQVKPDFDSTVNYQIFYYDILDNYISSTEVLSEGYSGEAPVNGAYARIVIEPRDDEDGKISLTERIKYPSQLTLKVKKNQDINERFCSFSGKLMQVVFDKDSLLFSKNLWFDPTTMTWINNPVCCVTSSTILKVQGGSTLTFDVSSLSESYSAAWMRIYQFKDIPLDENMIIEGFGATVDSSFVLNKSTKYIMIAVDSGSSSANWSDDVISKLPSCFSITKSK